MANSARNAARGSFLPAEMTALMGRRAIQLGGLVVAAGGLALAIALLSYHSTDPSLNRAVAGPVHNLLGLPGAFAGDLLLQSLGISCAFLPLALLLWGWRLANGQSLAPFWLRLTLLPIAIVAAAIALSAVTPPGGWPLRTGLGGVTGSLLLMSAKTGLAKAGVAVGPDIVGLVAAVIMLVAVTPALTLDLARLEDRGRPRLARRREERHRRRRPDRTRRRPRLQPVAHAHLELAERALVEPAELPPVAGRGSAGAAGAPRARRAAGPRARGRRRRSGRSAAAPAGAGPAQAGRDAPARGTGQARGGRAPEDARARRRRRLHPARSQPADGAPHAEGQSRRARRGRAGAQRPASGSRCSTISACAARS